MLRHKPLLSLLSRNQEDFLGESPLLCCLLASDLFYFPLGNSAGLAHSVQDLHHIRHLFRAVQSAPLLGSVGFQQFGDLFLQFVRQSVLVLFVRQRAPNTGLPVLLNDCRDIISDKLARRRTNPFHRFCLRTPDISSKRHFRSYMGNSYPYLHLFEMLFNIFIRQRNVHLIRT